jgi:hypothetical protein
MVGDGSGATIQARAWRFSMYVIALVSFGLLLVGAHSFRNSGFNGSGNGPSHFSARGATTNRITGYLSGGVQDQQIQSVLRQSGYEGGGTVVHIVDPITGLLLGTIDDQRVRALLTQVGYEGGGTVA